MMSWQDAENWCLDNYGSHLASVHSDSDWEDAKAVCGSVDCWLGGSCQGRQHGDWYWTDGSTWDYTNWHETQPDDYTGVDDCVQQFSNSQTTTWYYGEWGDQQCWVGNYPLCGIAGAFGIL